MPYKDADAHRRMDAICRRATNKRRRIEILNLLGGKCIECGFSDFRALAIDHKNGGGTAQHKATGGNYYNFVARSIHEGSTEYQCLCFNCNEIKKREKQEQNNLKYSGI